MKGLIDLAKWVFSICEMIRGYSLVIKHLAKSQFFMGQELRFPQNHGILERIFHDMYIGKG